TAIASSQGWALLQVLWRIRSWLAPPRSRREGMLRSWVRAMGSRPELHSLASSPTFNRPAIASGLSPAPLAEHHHTPVSPSPQPTEEREPLRPDTPLAESGQAVRLLSGPLTNQPGIAPALCAAVAEKQRPVQAHGQQETESRPARQA